MPDWLNLKLKTSNLRHLMKVLVVEDEAQIASFIENGLKEQGFAVDLCDNGVDGLDFAQNQSYDAIVLDIMPVSYTHLTLPTTSFV